MPDPTKQTISATEITALFNASPWVTRWMLYQRFANDLAIESPEDGRMSWGTKIEPLILEQTADDLKFEVRQNRGADGSQAYFRRGRLGCHRDGDIICPDRGPGAVEAKSVFDYKQWMSVWSGGKQPPRHVEIQTQAQMYVGDGHTPFVWGVIAVWIAGEVHYFEREPIPELWAAMKDEAAKFLAAVEAKAEPDPFGAPIETPLLTRLFPVTAGEIVDRSDDEALANIAVQYRDAKEQEAAGSRTAEPLRAKLLAAAKSAEEIILPAGIRVRVRAHGKGKVIKVFVPDHDAPFTQFDPNIMMAG